MIFHFSPACLLILILTNYCAFSQKPFVFDTYDTLYTIAGKGSIRDKDLNGWNESYENKSATQAELSRPHMAMSDSAGRIYIADKIGNAVRVIRKNGSIHTICGQYSENGSYKLSPLQKPNGIWVMPDGCVYVLDLGNNAIKKVNKKGALSVVVADPDGIVGGRGICVSPHEDTVYYSSGTVLKYYTEKSGIKVLASGFMELANIAFDSQGSLVVTDIEAGTVSRIGEKGNKTIIAGNPEGTKGYDGCLATEANLKGVCGIWFNKDNSFFICTRKESKVWYVDNAGKMYLFMDGEDSHIHKGDNELFNKPGKKISEPRSLTVDNAGNIIIVENDYGYVRLIKLKKQIFKNLK